MNDLILYSFRRCPFAMRARMTFLVMKIKYEIREIHLKEKPDEMIKLSGGKRSIPQIFYGDIHIGGSDDLYNMNVEGKLDQLIGLEIK